MTVVTPDQTRYGRRACRETRASPSRVGSGCRRDAIDQASHHLRHLRRLTQLQIIRTPISIFYALHAGAITIGHCR
jgi:hypothetical protein